MMISTNNVTETVPETDVAEVVKALNKEKEEAEAAKKAK